jgi:outer membrane protein assembly factor BamB
MKHRASLIAVALAALANAGVAAAQCPPDCPVKGGGDAATDCHSELASDAIRLNSPFFNPTEAEPKPAKEIRCFDGDPGCDLDGVANNSCTFDIDVCLRNADPDLPSCTPADVTEVKVSGSTTKYPGLATFQTAVDALLPATTNVCTSGQSVVVPLKGPTSKGEYKATKFSFKTKTTAGADDDSDRVKFVCVPRGWPGHSYDAQNTRSNPLETRIDATNAASLATKWTWQPPTSHVAANGRSISSTVTVGRKLLYTSAWNGRIYALDKKKGTLKWAFNTGSAPALGVQSSVTLTADGRALVADSLGILYNLDANTGELLWQVEAGNEDPDAAHAWGSPLVANNRVFLGIASHNDAPCTRGTLVAFDLDTGAELWRQYTVPEKICFDDTSVECSANSDCTAPGSPCLLGNCDSNPDTVCTTNGDCPSTFITAGTCVLAGECWLDRDVACTVDADCPACIPAKGGGVTATAAASADGNDIYMASVGCLSFPSVGNSDAMFRLDAATGAIEWVYRTEAPEQFQSFPVNQGPTYHDYGFLNGPILADVSDGMSGTIPVAVGGGKDGTLYAVNQVTGLLEWSNVLAPAPVFAGFGLFNGAVAYEKDTDRFFAALFDIPGFPDGDDHMLSFNGVDGATAWTGDLLSNSWQSPTVANGLVYAGTQADDSLFVFNTTTGALETTLAASTGNVMGGAAIDNGVVYVPFGNVFGGSAAVGGVRAFEIPAP